MRQIRGLWRGAAIYDLHLSGAGWQRSEKYGTVHGAHNMREVGHLQISTYEASMDALVAAWLFCGVVRVHEAKVSN